MSTYDPNWRSGLSHLDMNEERVRQVVYEAYQNITEVMTSLYAPGSSPREIGGLDKSAYQLAELLGIQYERKYHDDGCPIEDDDDGTGDPQFDGHDGGEGCEYGEQEPDDEI